jgi:hypothetical protein
MALRCSISDVEESLALAGLTENGEVSELYRSLKMQGLPKKNEIYDLI